MESISLRRYIGPFSRHTSSIRISDNSSLQHRGVAPTKKPQTPLHRSQKLGGNGEPLHLSTFVILLLATDINENDELIAILSH
jgi:hypothetical protein